MTSLQSYQAQDRKWCSTRSASLNCGPPAARKTVLFTFTRDASKIRCLEILLAATERLLDQKCERLIAGMSQRRDHEDLGVGVDEAFYTA